MNAPDRLTSGVDCIARTWASSCTTSAGANFFAPDTVTNDGTIVVTLIEQNTQLQRTVRIAPGGRVLPQP